MDLASRLAEVDARIADAARTAGRDPAELARIVVTKFHPASLVEQLYDLGVRDVGENRQQELTDKRGRVRDLPGLTWHFIGQIQANKTRSIAEHFAWVHGVDRLKIAERLSAQRPFHAPPLNVCLQLNVGGEASKGGVPAAEMAPLARAVRELPGLKLRGVMCMPPAETDVLRQRQWFREARQVFDYLNEKGGGNEQGLGLDTLSMGTSADYPAAIAEGATIVRIGTAVFGRRGR